MDPVQLRFRCVDIQTAFWDPHTRNVHMTAIPRDPATDAKLWPGVPHGVMTLHLTPEAAALFEKDKEYTLTLAPADPPAPAAPPADPAAPAGGSGQA